MLSEESYFAQPGEAVVPHSSRVVLPPSDVVGAVSTVIIKHRLDALSAEIIAAFVAAIGVPHKQDSLVKLT